MYIHIYMYVYLNIYVYIYIYMYRTIGRTTGSLLCALPLSAAGSTSTPPPMFPPFPLPSDSWLSVLDSGLKSTSTPPPTFPPFPLPSGLRFRVLISHFEKGNSHKNAATYFVLVIVKDELTDLLGI